MSELGLYFHRIALYTCIGIIAKSLLDNVVVIEENFQIVDVKCLFLMLRAH